MLRRFFMSVVAVLLLANWALAQNGKIIRGQVTDAQTGKPLPGANVFFIPTGAGAISDANGRFRFAAFGEAADSLRISFMGYRLVTLALAEINEALQIKLEAITLLFSETLVTATRQSAVRAEVPSATELVEINSPSRPVGMARQNIGEALTQAQSIFVKEYGSVSGLKTINLRGASDKQILVLADGVRLNNPQNGGVDASQLSLVGIEKIEIVRGNASAQYGSDAIGGVIHLRSFQLPAGFSGGLQTSGGSFGTFNGRAQFGYGRANWRGAVTLDRLVSDGDFPIDGAEKIKRRNNASQRREVFARLSGNLRDDLILKLLHRTGKITQGVPGSLQCLSPAARQQDLNHLTSAALDWNQSPLFQLAAQYSTERRDQRYNDPEPCFPPPFASHHEVASDIGVIQNRTQLNPGLDVLIGGEIGGYRVTSTDFAGIERQRTQRSAFVQIEWRPFVERHPGSWRLAVIPSLRYDDYSDAGKRSSPKLALALYRQIPSSKHYTTGRLSLHGNIGKSFRAPSMNDLWYKDPFFAGNPNLRPERGREIEGGMIYEFSRLGHWQLELTAFDSKIDDLIISTPDFSSLENANKAKLGGIELGAAWRNNGDRFGWRANYARLSAKNDGNDTKTRDKALVYRPRDKFDLQANFDLRYFTLGGNFQYVGKRFSRADNSQALPAYRVANFSLSRQIHFNEFSTLLHLEMRNVFDKHFSIIDGYPLPGRELRATLRLGI